MVRFAAAALLALSAVAAPAAAQEDSKIAYRTVAEAHEALTKAPGHKVERQGPWLVVSKPNVIWTFTGPGHEAHPAVAKRSLVERDGRLFLDMYILCEAAKPACDRLHGSFKELNAQMQRALRQRR